MSDTQAATSRSGEVVVNDLGAVPHPRTALRPPNWSPSPADCSGQRAAASGSSGAMTKAGSPSTSRGNVATTCTVTKRCLRMLRCNCRVGVTDREINILTLLALGLTNVQIAGRLGTSAHTVSTQIERMLVKLGQPSRGGLALRSPLMLDSSSYPYPAAPTDFPR